ncbi:formyltransferase family protein [uncultured Legionella sp.]|uniref:formyltransferase family protein n=1 Tax=uncultured Legionella sp. TaxID=210934 RepID=UPI00261C118D|nr:formyltransferase family protein [uncultured Legionella sp.]
MKNNKDIVVYVAKAKFKFGKLGLDIVRQYFENIIVIPYDECVQGDEGKSRIRHKLKTLEYDYLISFWSELYIKKEELEKAKKGAINIHPAPPEHPGLGMFTFLRIFPHLRAHHGVTLHEIDAKMDHGQIYRTTRFSVENKDDWELVNDTSAISLQFLEDACIKLSTGCSSRDLQNEECRNEKWKDTFYTSTMEQEWISHLPAEHPTRRLDCISLNTLLYNEFGAHHDSLIETL